MNYEQTELLDRLAGEYALGTLRGPARRRFERVCSQSAAARRALYRWEDDWSLLSRRLPPVQPPPRVWANVRRQLFGEVSRPPRTRWRTWQLTVAAGLVAVALVVGLLVREVATAVADTRGGRHGQRASGMAARAAVATHRTHHGSR